MTEPEPKRRYPTLIRPDTALRRMIRLNAEFNTARTPWGRLMDPFTRHTHFKITGARDENQEPISIPDNPTGNYRSFSGALSEVHRAALGYHSKDIYILTLKPSEVKTFEIATYTTKLKNQLKRTILYKKAHVVAQKFKLPHGDIRFPSEKALTKGEQLLAVFTPKSKPDGIKLT